MNTNSDYRDRQAAQSAMSKANPDQWEGGIDEALKINDRELQSEVLYEVIKQSNYPAKYLNYLADLANRITGDVQHDEIITRIATKELYQLRNISLAQERLPLFRLPYNKTILQTQIEQQAETLKRDIK